MRLQCMIFGNVNVSFTVYACIAWYGNYINDNSKVNNVMHLNDHSVLNLSYDMGR